jgi:hypothetical protein
VMLVESGFTNSGFYSRFLAEFDKKWPILSNFV